MLNSKYLVKLLKTIYGLGIYFIEYNGYACVHFESPFYKLPNGEKAPGEASSIIQPGDQLIKINDIELITLKFLDIINLLRKIKDNEYVYLTFRPFRFPKAIEENIKTQIVKTNDSKVESIYADKIEDSKKTKEISTIEFNAIDKKVNELIKENKKLKELYLKENKCCNMAKKRLELYRQEIYNLYQENINLRMKIKYLNKYEIQENKKFINDIAIISI